MIYGKSPCQCKQWSHKATIDCTGDSKADEQQFIRNDDAVTLVAHVS